MPYKDPAVAKARKHEYYMRNRERTMDRIRRYKEEHPEVKKRADRKYNQRRNAPYHGVMDRAGIERRCVECGSVESLGVHHIDGDHGNDSLSNLQWMCVSCHARLHARIRKEKCLPEATERPSEALEGAVGASVPDGAPEAEEGASEAREEV